MTSIFERRAKELNYQNESDEHTYFNKFTGQMDTIGSEPYRVPKKEDESIFAKRAKEIEPEEGWGKWALRSALQIPKGIAQAATFPLELINMAGTAEAIDPGTLQDLRFASEKAGKTFNEDEYREGAETVSQSVPTVTNAASMLENKTGIPLEAKTNFQKFINFAAQAGKLSPKGYTLKGMNTSLPRPVLGTAIAGTAEVGKALGLPEPVADIGSFAILKKPTTGAGSISIGSKTKESGLPERQYESLSKPREVSQGKLNKINQKVESDFRKIADDIVLKSELGNTAKEIVTNPNFKNESIELMEQAKEVAKSIPENKTVSLDQYRKEIANVAKKNSEGFSLTEYDKDYLKYMLEAQESLKVDKINPVQLVEQYRINNQSLTEYFEPGRSKATNRAKRNALLDQNKAIANVMENHYPETDLSKVFKAGNERWSKIKDFEMVDEFVNQIFTENINFKKVNDFFDKSGYAPQFKKALGKEGYHEFQTLMKDMLSNEKGYKMLTLAKDKGFDNLFKLGASYILHPKLAMTKLGFDKLKSSFKFMTNLLLDNPKLTLTYKEAVKNLKEGNFKQAEEGFKKLEAVKPTEITNAPQVRSSPKVEPPIEVKVEPIKNSVSKQEALDKFNERKAITKQEPLKQEVKKTDIKENFNLDDYDYKYDPKLGRNTFKPKVESSLSRMKSEQDAEIEKLFGNPKPKPQTKKVISPEAKKIKAYNTQLKEIDSTLATIEADLRYKAEQQGWDQSRINDKISDRKALKKKRENLNEKLENIKNPKAKVETRTYNEVQQEIDKLEDLKPTPNLNKQIDDLYKVRDQIGINELKTEVDSFKSEFKDKLSPQEMNDVLDALSLPKGEIVASDIYFANEYLPKTISDAKGLIKDLSAKFSRDFIDVDSLNDTALHQPQIVKKATQIVKDIREHFGIRDTKTDLIQTKSTQIKIDSKPKVDTEFRDRFNNAPKGNDQRSYDADKLKKNPIKSEKDLVNEMLQLKKQRDQIKGRDSNSRDLKSDLNDKIKTKEKEIADIIKKRKSLESSLVEKSERSVNKYSPKDLKNQKDYILKSIDDALKNPSNKEFLEIKVPDDGTFKIYNIEEVLEKFKSRVKSSYPIKQLKGKI